MTTVQGFKYMLSRENSVQKKDLIIVFRESFNRELLQQYNPYIKFTKLQRSKGMSLIVKLAEHSHPSLNPVLWALACGQHHGDDKVGGVTCGRQSSLTLTGLIERTHIDILGLRHNPLIC